MWAAMRRYSVRTVRQFALCGSCFIVVVVFVVVVDARFSLYRAALELALIIHDIIMYRVFEP